VDIVNFNGNFLSRVRDIAGANLIILVVTKVKIGIFRHFVELNRAVRIGSWSNLSLQNEARSNSSRASNLSF
ncbi:NO-associated protein 1, chloroplastic/mitochondrial-like protein, partial [Corchorus capsularis]